jgi:hypothetical protein
MSTPMNYTEFAQAVFAKLDSLEKRIIKMAEQVEEIYNDSPSLDDGPRSNVVMVPDEELTTEEQVKRYGQKIPYNLIDDVIDIEQFRDFIYTAKSNNRLLTPFELEYLDRADKNFEDVRLSSKHLQILKTIYLKVYGKPWPFKYKQGYMYKLEPYPLGWEWFK